MSTGAQDLSLQLDALQQQGCRKQHIFIDERSGGRTQCAGLDACLEMLQPGDVLLVWRLDRLGRSMPHLVSLITTLRERGVGFRSLAPLRRPRLASWSLRSSQRSRNSNNALSKGARAPDSKRHGRGEIEGKKLIAPDDPHVTMTKTMHKDTTVSIMTICHTLNISRATFYRYLNLSANPCWSL